MLITLFLKECKQMAKCLTYYVVVICILFMYTTQIGSDSVVKKPEPGQKEYGYTISEDENVIMEETIKKLAMEYTNNNYSTYPFFFLKKVTLSKTKQSQIGDILAEVTGIIKKSLKSELKKYFEAGANPNSMTFDQGAVSDDNKMAVSKGTVNINNIPIPIVKGLSYQHFTELMIKADKLLGGGSSYARDELQRNAYVPMTYEQAVEQYNQITKNDQISGAYARLFSDYMGIILAILPIFLIVTRGLRDKRAKADEIIFSRKAPSYQIILSRYLASVVMILQPIILLACFQMIDCIYAGQKAGITVNYFAYVEYITGWLLPTILIVTSVGAFFTELTNSAIAIIIQGIWWILSVTSGNLIGNCAWNLVPRHNSLYYYNIFKQNLNQLVMNRISYTIAAVIILIVTVYVYELKRKGRINIRGKIFSNRKIKSVA